MLASQQNTYAVKHIGVPTSPAASLRQDVRAPLSSISDNTTHSEYMSQSPSKIISSEPSTADFSTPAGRFMNSAADAWRTPASEDEPSENMKSFMSEPPDASLTSQDRDPEPSRVISEDPAVAGLASRMQKSVVIKDVAVQTPKMIAVPKGFAVTYDTKPTEHFRDRREVKVHVKRKRDEGMLPKPLPKAEQSEELYGFRAHEINSAGAVTLPSCRASSLVNDVHPLLARARFDDTPDAIYDELVPALRLASMFLTQPVCMQFWVTLAFAEREDDPDMSLKYGKRCQRIVEHVEMTEENVTAVTQRLQDMGNANLIHFAFRNRTAMPSIDTWGCSWPIRDYRGAVGRDLTRSLIRLHADYYIVAEKLSQLKYPEQSQQLRFSFIFAVIILHELAHSIEGAYIKRRHDQWLDLQHTKQYIEPFFMDWQRPPECGRTLEQTMFGGEVHPINKRVDGSHGVCISDWPPTSSMGDSQRRVWYTVPMQYVQDLFRIETWKQQGHLHDWKSFHIPRTGATSLYIFSFTTMPWSEEQRAANEEAAELLAIAKAQPPTKKRLIASGAEEEQRGDEKAAMETVMGKDKAVEVENRFSRSRRNSSFMLDAHREATQTSRYPLRSRSANPKRRQSLTTHNESSSKVEVDELLRRFVEIYDSLPARRDSGTEATKAPTSEILKRSRRSRRHKSDKQRENNQLTSPRRHPTRRQRHAMKRKKRSEANAKEQVEANNVHADA